MVAVVTGTGLGIERGSNFVLGSKGQMGDSNVGFLGSSVTVNARSGNLIILNQDEILTGRGPDVNFLRNENSQGPATDDNGDNWRESSQRTVGSLSGTVNTAGSSVIRTDWDGSNTWYNWDASKNAYVCVEGVGAYDTLTFASNVWTWTDGNSRTVETYDSLNGGRITTSKDTDGNQLTFHYTSGKLTSVDSPNGDWVDLIYSGNNLVEIDTCKAPSTIVDKRVRYSYDASNRLATVTIDLSPSDNIITDGNVVTYTYTYDGTSKRVASISETGTSNVISFTYVSLDKYRVQTVTETGSDGGTRVTSFSYDTVNNKTTITDALLKTTEFTYDADGNLTQIKYPPATASATQQIVQYAYNSNSDLISATDAAGHVTNYSYDSNGNVLQVRDAAGNTIDYTYGSKNELLNEIHYLTPDPDGPGAGTASSPVVVRRAYDSENHLRFVVDADGFVTEYRYNTPGQPVSKIKYTSAAYNLSSLTKTDALSETTLANWVAALSGTDQSLVQRADATYDYRGNLSTVVEYSAADSTGAGVTTSPYTTTTYVYDQFGLLLSKQVSGISGSEVYTYDGLGRLLSSTDLAGNTTTTTISNGTRTTTVTLANGLVKTSVYSAQGELVSYSESGSDISTESESYKYDKLGRLRITSDALSQRDFVFYDDAGRKVGYLDRRGFLTEYQYDVDNRLVATIAYKTVLTSSAIATLYDANGNPTTATIASVRPASDTADVWTWNIYDYANRLIETIDGQGSATVYAYDGDDRLVQTSRYANAIAAATVTGYKTTPPTGLVTPTADATHDQVTRYFYDNSGRKIGTLDADGALTQTNYDKAGRVIETIGYANFVSTTALKTSGTFSQLVTDVTTTANAADRHNYVVYDGRGDVRYTLDANLRPTEYVYDSANNVIRTIDYGAPIGSGSSYSLPYVQSQISTLNLANNVDTRVTRCVYDSAGRKAYEINAGDVQGSYVTAYGYNAAGQIVKQTRYYNPYTLAGDPSLSDMQTWVTGNANGNDRLNRQIFDMLGRLAYEVDAQGYVTRHVYDLDDRLIEDIRYASVPSPLVTDSTTKASLDTQLGSTIPSDAVTHAYNYDQNGNLTDAYDGNNVQTHYSYDAFGRAYSIIEAYGTSDAAETRIVFDTANRVQSKTTAYGVAAAATTYYGYDALGNITSITDANNGLTTRSYDAAGNMLTETVQLDASTNAVTSRAYNAFGQLWRLTDPRLNAGYFYYDRLGRLELQIDAEGYATATTYTIGDQPASTTRYYTRATNLGQMNTRPTLTTNAKDATTQFKYDKLDRLTSVIDAEQYYTPAGVFEYAHEDYTLNAFGDREQVRNRLGGTTVNTFNKRGLLTQEVLPISSTDNNGTLLASTVTNSYSYDARGNRTQMIEAVGLPEQRTTNYIYDHNNRLKSTYGDAVAVQNADRTTTTNTVLTENRNYDSRGNLIEIIDPAGGRTLSYYDHNNRKIAEINAVGTLTKFTLDANGNATSRKIFGDAVALPAAAGGTPPSPVDANNYRETLYSYDRNNRMYQTRVVAVDFGESSGGVYSKGNQDIITGTTYDAAGNVILQTDARLNKIFSFYDKNGHKIAQVDQENYLTTYDLDDEGNVLTETRYATKLTVVVGTGSDPTALKTNAGNSADDRITQFNYDRNGRRTSEARLNMSASTVNATTGALSTASQTATIYFQYNGLGLVTKKTEANGDVTDTTFDKMGRMIEVQKAGYTDYTGATVRPTTDMQYDGLNELSRQVVRGTDNSVETDDRITRYSYDKLGRVVSTTDANNIVNSSYYDAAGRVVKQSWSRLKSDGSSATEAQFFAYDLLGRETSQFKGTFVSGTSWTLSTSTNMKYNGFGDTTGRGINIVGNTPVYQEFADYDKMGRVWRTNFGDGITKAYIYDANGNATLLLQAVSSADLKSMTVDQMVAANSGVTETQSVYDKRNQLIETIQPSIQNAGQLSGSINQFQTVTAGSNFTGGAVSVGSTRSASGASGAVSSNPGSVTTNPSGSFNVNRFNLVGNREGFKITWGNFLPYGGTLHIYLSSSTMPYQKWGDFSPSSNEFDFNTPFQDHSVNVYIYQDVTVNDQVLIAQGVSPTEGNTPLSVPSTIQFQGQSANTSNLMMLAKVHGATGPYQVVSASQVLNSANAGVAGWFSINAAQFSGLTAANTSWDLLYYAQDSSGTTLNTQTALLTVNSSGVPSISAVTAVPIHGPGQVQATWDSTYYTLLFADFPAGAQSVRVYYRQAGTSGPFTNLPVNGTGGGAYGLPRWWTGRPPSTGGPYEFWVESYSGANWTGTMLSKSYGTFTGGAQPSGLTAYADLPETVHFYNQPSAANLVKLWYKPSGSGTWIQSSNLVWNAAIGAWDWDANAIAPDHSTNYLYDFRYETYNGSLLVNQAHGQVQLGYDPATLSNISDSMPTTAAFVPGSSQGSATTLVLNYRPAGSTSATYTTVTVPKAASGRFEWNVEALRPATGSVTYEYFYDLYDASGNLVPPDDGEDHTRGYIDVTAAMQATTRDLQWVLVGSPDPAAIIDRKQGYDAFGDIKYEVDGLNHQTDLVYNVMGKLVQKQSPTVAVIDQHGNSSNQRATERYYYDISGRLVGAQDANSVQAANYVWNAGDINTLQLLAGSGENPGENAVTVKEFHVDGGIKTNGIDIFGDVRKITNELNAVTLQNFDKMGRVTQVIHPTRVGGNSSGVSLTDNYTYDGLGQRITHWNSQLGSTVIETTDYDIEGRVVSTKSFAGQTASYRYTYYDGSVIQTAGMGAFGGWRIDEATNGEADTISEVHYHNTDIFGRLVWQSDMSNRYTAFIYNAAGELVHQQQTTNNWQVPVAGGQDISYDYYGNGYVKSVTDNTLHMQSIYEYDKEGNRTFESYTTTDAGNLKKYYQVADITYDAMNRISSFTDAKATITYAYDANSNRREVKSVYHDGLNGAQQVQDYWYLYDKMNRFTLTMGTLSGGVGGNIVTGSTGVLIGYDKASERVSALNGSDGSQEAYTYTADGYLEDTTINGVLRARRVNDAMGRVTTYNEYGTGGLAGGATYSKTSTYDADNRVTHDVVAQGTATTDIYNDYRALSGTTYTGADLGVTTHSTSHQQGTSVTVDTTYSYGWWEEAKQTGIQMKGDDPNNPNTVHWAPGASQLSYDVNGHLTQATITGGAFATITYENDAYGQVLVREAKTGNTIGPRQLYYYFDGNRIGDVGNDGPSRVDYAQALALRAQNPKPGTFRAGKPVASADFDENYEPVGPGYPAQAASSYTVRDGDTLQSIAQSAWGDSSMWYLIADANGLDGSESLQANQRLIIPNKVTNIHNRAGVYRVYDPGEAIGDAMPLLPAEPAPPGHKGCGAFGQILLAVIAIAVVAVTQQYEVFAGLGSIGAGAASAVAGSLVSQAVGVATGIQDKFSFKAVALAAISGGIGGAMPTGDLIQGAGHFVNDVARGVLTNVATQGVAVATGLQGKFDWTGVAAAGVLSGVGGIAERTATHLGLNTWTADGAPLNRSEFAIGQAIRGMAGDIAGAATRSALDGTDFGDNILAVLPDAIGSTIGGIAASAITARNDPLADVRADLAAQGGYTSLGDSMPITDLSDTLPSLDDLLDTQSGSILTASKVPQTAAGGGVASTIVPINGTTYVVIGATNFNPKSSNGLTAIPSPAVMAAAASGQGLVSVTYGTNEKGGFIVLDAAGNPIVSPLTSGKAGGNALQDTLSFGPRSSWPSGVLALIHGHIDNSPTGDADDGMVDAPLPQTPYGDTGSLAGKNPIPTATVSNGLVGWHVLVNGQLQFWYPQHALTPSQARSIQKNLNKEQPLFR